MNRYMSAFLVYTVVGIGATASPTTEPSTKVASLVQGMPAAAAGILVGDKVVAIDGQPLKDWQDMLERIGAKANQPIKLTVERDGKSVDVAVTPQFDTDPETGAKVGKIGVRPDQSTAHITFTPTTGGLSEVVTSYWTMAWRLSVAPIVMVKNLFTGKQKLSEVKDSAGGPLLIGSMLLDAASEGTWKLLFLWCVISTLVGGFNLLPIPALDGMRGFLVLVGAIRRKPIDQDKEALVHTVGLAFLLTLVLILTVQDVQKLHSGFHMLMQ